MTQANGRRITLVHPPDRDGQAVLALLGELGYAARTCWPMPAEAADDMGILMVRVTNGQVEPAAGLLGGYDGICIALVEAPAPRIFDKVFASHIHGVVVKPVRRADVMAQIAIAAANHGYQARLRDRLAHVESNLRARRTIERATQALMGARGLTDEEAYEFLRREAMRRRVPIGDMASDILSGAQPAIA
jgi:AmiR/NasT family two-component response regulator